VTLQALSAILGGTQSLHTNSMDEALGLPSEAAVRIALRTQQIIAHESGVADTIDPLAGSYAIEALTDAIENRALKYIKNIDQLGGALSAIEAGFIQREIAESAFQLQSGIENGKEISVGVNDFLTDEKITITPLKVNPTIEVAQKEHLANLRARRNENVVAPLLDKLAETARKDGNMMPVFIECVEGMVTLGEICEKLREIWGEYEPPPIL
jgi:methylmalonyl-CoA mutase N-terminal domain/subunit